MTVRKLRDAVLVMGAFLALIWTVQVVNWAAGYRLDAEFGIFPQRVSSLPDIFSAPFLHFSWQHIEGNSVPLFVLGVLAAYRSILRFLLLSLIVIVTSGLGVWLFQAGNELTVGASGLIFGYFGYVLVRGFVDRSPVDIAIGVGAGLLYWTILLVAIPGTPGISWIGHLSGLAGGVLAAWMLRTRGRALAGRRTAGLGGGQGGRGPGGSGPGGSGPGGSGPGGGRPGGSRPGAAGAGQDGRPGAAPRQNPGSQAAEDLLRELRDMGL